MPQQQPPKEKEEDEDEEQGEGFSFEDSGDEEKPQGDSKGIPSDSVGSVQSSKKEDSETTGSSSLTSTDCTQLPITSPPAGQEEILTKDVDSNSTAGNTFARLMYRLYDSIRFLEQSKNDKCALIGST